MNLNGLLKVNSVRCIKTKVHEDLVEGEIYEVEGFNDETIKIVDRNGFSSWHNKNLFEPVPNNDIDLDELLKCKKVKCVASYDDCLTVGKDYIVVGADVELQVKDDDEGFSYWGSDCFEPVLDNPEIDISENSVNIVNTTFKVGDKVYKFGETDVKTVLEVFDDGDMRISDYPHRVNHETLCHATQENYEMLCKLYSHIEFKLPPKPLAGSDLCRAMLDKGWKLVPCVVSGISDSEALNNDNYRLVDKWYTGRFDSCFHSGDYSYKYAVPFDPKTGIPLTEDVLNEIN